MSRLTTSFDNKFINKGGILRLSTDEPNLWITIIFLEIV